MVLSFIPERLQLSVGSFCPAALVDRTGECNLHAAPWTTGATMAAEVREPDLLTVALHASTERANVLNYSPGGIAVL